MHQLSERMVGNRNGEEKAMEKDILEHYLLVIDHLWNHDTLNHSVIDKSLPGEWRKGRYSPTKNDGLVRRLRTDDLVNRDGAIIDSTNGGSYVCSHNTLSHFSHRHGERKIEVDSPRPIDDLTRIMSSHDIHLAYYLSPYGFNINGTRKNRIVNKNGFEIRLILMPVRDGRVHSLLVSWIRRLPPTHPPPYAIVLFRIYSTGVLLNGVLKMEIATSEKVMCISEIEHFTSKLSLEFLYMSVLE